MKRLAPFRHGPMEKAPLTPLMPELSRLMTFTE
jgi:hypothetical protein